MRGGEQTGGGQLWEQPRVSSLWSSCPSASAHLTVTSRADGLSDVGSVPASLEAPLSLEPSSHPALGLQTPGPTAPVVGCAPAWWLGSVCRNRFT